MHGMSSYPVHSPVHSPVHGPEFSFYTNPNHIAAQHNISATVYPTISEKPGLLKSHFRVVEPSYAISKHVLS